MQYRLWVYVLPNDEKPEAAYEAAAPFGAFSVGDLLHPTWRTEAGDTEHAHAEHAHTGQEYVSGDVLEVVRVERHLLGDAHSGHAVLSATRDDTVLHCVERLSALRRPVEEPPIMPWDFELFA